MSLRHSRWIWILLLALVLAVIANSVAAQTVAQGAANGRVMYETYCGDCHYERIHQRDRARSKVSTLADLRAQITRWSAQTKRGYSPQELADIAEYLNQSYYRLDK
ncbi:MAG: hypothetical protein ACKVQK_06540 [Burkholderiales bacterium]